MRLYVALDRALSLLLEYPALGLAASFVSLYQGLSVSKLTLLSLVVASLLVAACLHLYHLARQRVQQLADGMTAGEEISTNFCFTSVELHELFELWRRRALFWRALDYGSVAHFALFFVKIVGKAGCAAATYKIMPLAVFSLALVRLLYRERLSSASYSMLSLTANTFIWVTHCGFMLAGDPCFGALAREPYSRALPTQVLFACATLAVMNLITPVGQAYLPVKLGIAFVGSLSSSYMHTLYRDGTLRSEEDPEGWNVFWLCIGIFASCMATFHVNTRLVEAAMCRFLRLHFARGE
jgi:hypothetical protein